MALGLSGAGLALLWIFARIFLGWIASCIVVTGYLSSAFVVGGLIDCYNSSFVYLFSAGALLSLSFAFAPLSFTKYKTPAWFLACGICSLGIQLHYTIGLFMLAGLWLQLQHHSFRVVPLPYRQFIFGLALFFLGLVPYLLWSGAAWAGFVIGQPPPAYAGRAFNGMVFLVWMSYGHLLAAWHAHHLMQSILDFISERLFSDRLISIVTIAILLAFWWKRRARPYVRAPDFARTCFSVQIAALILTFVPTLLLQLTGHFPRYLNCAGVVLVLIPASLFHLVERSQTKWIEQWQSGYRAWVGQVALFILLGWHLQVHQAHMTDSVDFSFKFTADDFKTMAQIIYSETGWSYPEAQGGLFYINVHNSETPAQIYPEVMHAPNSGNASHWDGYFVIRTAPEDIPRLNADWLIKQDLAADLAQALREQKLIVQPARQVTPRLALISYQVRDRRHYPQHFHNLGDSYQSGEENLIEAEAKRAMEHPQQIVQAVFNDCPGHASYCRVAISVQSKDLADPTQDLEVQIHGIPLTMQSPFIAPDWTEALWSPFIRLHCGRESVQVKLTRSIGFFRKSDWTLNHSFVTPFVRTIHPRCTAGIESIELGFIGGSAIQMMGRSRLPGDRQIFHLAATRSLRTSI